LLKHFHYHELTKIGEKKVPVENELKPFYRNLIDEYGYLGHGRERWVMMLPALLPHVTPPFGSSRSYITLADMLNILLNDRRACA
jgi:hypothetical protein